MLDQRHRARRPVLRHDERRALGVDVLVELREPEAELERRIFERLRELVAQVSRRRLLEVDDQLADVHPREARAQKHPEEG